MRNLDDAMTQHMQDAPAAPGHQTIARRLRTWIGAAALAGAAAPAAPAPHAALTEQLAAIAHDREQALASLSVLAIRDGQVSYQAQFGQRRIGAPGAAPATPDTLFRIASMSKMMTTIGVMRLVEDGTLALDEDVGSYLGHALRNPHFPDCPVTLRSLLSHTSSLRDGAGYSWGAEVRLRDVLTPGAARYGDGAAWAAHAPPGHYFQYSNLNWGVIGSVMERVSGERFDRLMRRLLLAPMGLRGGYNPAEFSAAELDDTATLYRKRTVATERWDAAGPWIAQADDFRARPPAPPAGIERYVPGDNGTLFSPTGGLRISAADLGKVMRMLMQGGEWQGRRILRPDSVALMFSPQWTADEGGANGDTGGGRFRSWGLGSQRFVGRPGGGDGLVEGGGFGAVGHLGDAYGLLSAFVLDPGRRNGMIVLIGGTAADPARSPGRHSALPRVQERLLDALYRGAIAGPAASPSAASDLP